MKYSEINQKFTEKVSAYLTNGYIISTATMSGSQGEVAHIDLTNGFEIVRVLLTTAIESDHSGIYRTLSLVVGKAEKNIIPNSDNTDWQTIWNDRLEVIDSETRYELYRSKVGTAYGAKAEAGAIQEKQCSRYQNRHSGSNNTDITSDATIKIVTP